MIQKLFRLLGIIDSLCDKFPGKCGGNLFCVRDPIPGNDVDAFEGDIMLTPEQLEDMKKYWKETGQPLP